jgi:acid-sensing ion channel, other
MFRNFKNILYRTVNFFLVDELKFIKDDRTPKFIKFLWILIYAFSIISLIVYMREIVVKFIIDPDIGMNEKFKLAREIPFPALTICSPVVMKPEYGQLVDYIEKYKYEKIVKNLSKSEQDYVAVKTQVCALLAFPWVMEGTKDRDESDLVKLLNTSAPTIEDTFYECNVRYRQVQCKNILNRVLSDHGFCYTMNSQNLDDIFNKEVISSDFDSYKLNNPEYSNIWSLENGYNSPEVKGIPYRAERTSVFNFRMTLKDSDMSDPCYIFRNGYKVILHMPNEIPTFFNNYELIDLDMDTTMSVVGKVYSSEHAMRKYSVIKRGCYFESEKKLKFFKSYTKNNCIFECITNYTLRQCGCVKYSFPRTNDTRVCGLSDSGCHVEAYETWPEMDIMSNSSEVPCNCYPPCTDIKYSVTFKQAGKKMYHSKNG